MKHSDLCIELACVTHRGAHEIVDYTQEGCVTSLQSPYVDTEYIVLSKCI